MYATATENLDDPTMVRTGAAGFVGEPRWATDSAPDGLMIAMADLPDITASNPSSILFHPSVFDLMAGHIDMYFGNASEILPMASSDTIRLLRISTEKRLPNLANLPTVGETLPGLVVEAWNGLLAPAGLPAPVLQILEREAVKGVRDPAVIEKLQNLGIVPRGSTAAEFAVILKQERSVYRDAVTAAGIASGR